MANCKECGNEYDKSFEVIKEGKTHAFDSFRMRDSCACADVRTL
jgi:hypothetical protein